MWIMVTQSIGLKSWNIYMVIVKVLILLLIDQAPQHNKKNLWLKIQQSKIFQNGKYRMVDEFLVFLLVLIEVSQYLKKIFKYYIF